MLLWLQKSFPLDSPAWTGLITANSPEAEFLNLPMSRSWSDRKCPAHTNTLTACGLPRPAEATLTLQHKKGMRIKQIWGWCPQLRIPVTGTFLPPGLIRRLNWVLSLRILLTCLRVFHVTCSWGPCRRGQIAERPWRAPNRMCNFPCFETD